MTEINSRGCFFLISGPSGVGPEEDPSMVGSGVSVDGMTGGLEIWVSPSGMKIASSGGLIR